MKRLLIIGAGDLGRELESMLDLTIISKEWNIGGYLDSNPKALENFPSDYKIIGDPISFSYQENDICVFAISNPTSKKYIWERIKGRVKLFTYISPMGFIGKFCKIGEGTVICPNALISTNVKIGDCVTINSGTQVGHDVVIGNYTSLMANIDIGGHCSIGTETFIGSGATVIPKRKIGSNTKIGAGSVVLSHIGDSYSVFGNPARKM